MATITERQPAVCFARVWLPPTSDGQKGRQVRTVFRGGKKDVRQQVAAWEAELRGAAPTAQQTQWRRVFSLGAPIDRRKYCDNAMSGNSRDLRLAINRSPAVSRAALIIGVAILAALAGLAIWQSATAAATALPIIIASAVGLIIAFRRRDT